jgi:hypothetical protein
MFDVNLGYRNVSFTVLYKPSLTDHLHRQDLLQWQNKPQSLQYSNFTHKTHSQVTESQARTQNNGSRGVSLIPCCSKPLTSVSIYRRVRTHCHSDPTASLFHIQLYCGVWQHELLAFVMNFMAEEEGRLPNKSCCYTKHYGSSHNLNDIRMKRRRFTGLFRGSVGLVVLITSSGVPMGGGDLGG